MKIATVLFTYNRSEHTKKVLDALALNETLPEKLFIFHDGFKETTDLVEWQKVKTEINAVDWCDVEVIERQRNLGLAKSIMYGLDFVFSMYDAVIVLEDDCVPHILFMTYMTRALQYYEKHDKVYSVSGYAWPVKIEPNGTDVYFTKRINSCGWATWKNRWSYFEQDYRILARIKKNSYLNQQFHIWGEDLESYLLGNVKGICDSWAVFWALKVIEKDGYCVAPYKSLIENIGFDGSGVHCGANKIDVAMSEDAQTKEFLFDNSYEISENTEQMFADYFAWTSKEEKNTCYFNILLQWMQLHFEKKTVNDYFRANGITHISIWGRGKLCELFLQEISDSISLDAIIETKPSLKEYHGIPVIGKDDIPESTQIIVVMPVYDKDKIMRKFKNKELPVIGIDELVSTCGREKI